MSDIALLRLLFIVGYIAVALPMALYKYVYDYDYDLINCT